eukprot:759490-Hanusia_phi.AAC.7
MIKNAPPGMTAIIPIAGPGPQGNAKRGRSGHGNRPEGQHRKNLGATWGTLGDMTAYRVACLPDAQATPRLRAKGSTPKTRGSKYGKHDGWGRYKIRK